MFYSVLLLNDLITEIADITRYAEVCKQLTKLNADKDVQPVDERRTEHKFENLG